MATDNSYVNALIGAAVTVVLSFLPFAPLLGGAVAGFLERRDGGRIGLLSAIFASVPLFLLLLFVGGVVAVVPGLVGGQVTNAVLLALLVVGVLLAYVVGFSVVGGIIGVYLGEEFRDD